VKGPIIGAFVDPKTRHVLWRGSASAQLDAATMGDPEATEKRVSEAVQKILARYPPK
jgi:Domain of unknown function (DUF4136)